MYEQDNKKDDSLIEVLRDFIGPAFDAQINGAREKAGLPPIEPRDAG